MGDNFLTFLNMIEAVEAQIAQSGAKRDIVKAAINMTLLTELSEADDLYPLYWLLTPDDQFKSKVPAEAITGITAAEPPIVSDATHKFVVGDVISLYDIEGMTEANGRMFVVGTVTAGVSYGLHNFDTDKIDGTTWTAWTSGGKAVHRGISLSSITLMKRIISAGWANYDGVMEPATIKDIESSTRYLGSYDNDYATRPTRYLHMKRNMATGDMFDYLIWFPGADAEYHLRMWHEFSHFRLDDDGDVPVLPFQFHDILISGAITRLIESNVQVENAIVWPSIYQSQLNNLINFNRRWWELHESGQHEKPYLL